MRGRVGYVTLMVLNPILIILYQNFSVVPASAARAQAAQTQVSSRAPASLPATLSAGASSEDCDLRFRACPQPMD